jgi:hypothetical protein
MNDPDTVLCRIAHQEKINIRKAMNTLEHEFQLHKKKIDAVMSEDAKLNGIPVSKLNPANYGLGVDPRHSKIYQHAKQQEQLCDKMWNAGKDVEATFKSSCSSGIKPNSMSLYEVNDFFTIHHETLTTFPGVVYRQCESPLVTRPI